MTDLQETRSYAITQRLWPEVAQMDERRRLQAVETIVQLLYLSPFAIVGLALLIVRTDYSLLGDNIERLAVLFVVMLLLLLQPFDVRIRLDRKGEQELKISSSLAPLVMWSTLFLHGAAGLWAMVLAATVANLYRSWQIGRYGQNPVWKPLSTFVQEISIFVFTAAIAAIVYVALGGAFPVAGDEFSDWLPAFLTAIFGALLSGLVMLPAGIQIDNLAGEGTSLGGLLRFYAGVVALPLVMGPFAVIIAVLNSEGRTLSLVFIVIGIYLVNRLANHMSRANARSRRQAREFAELQTLGEAIIEAPADASTLPDLLADHLARLFPVERVEVFLFEPSSEKVWAPFHIGQPDSLPPAADELWQQLRNSQETIIELKDVRLAGQRFVFGDALLAKITAEDPKRAGEDGDIIGGVYLLRHGSIGKARESTAAVQSLASQVSSALYRAEVHAETLAFYKTQQELEFAGSIQTSFLPTSVPEADKWQISAVLDSARQTSGDFYDFIPLDGDQIGIVVADVSDKGTGAALYMALSRTLLRTYAMESGQQPEIALQRTNDRIRQDAETDQFVTLIYGILDSKSGRFIYANAGHNPGYLLRAGGEEVEKLTHTGIPLGMFEGMEWKQAEVQINPGDVLMLYSDGVPEAQNDAPEEYGDDRFIEIGQANMGRPADEIQEAILTSLYDFVAGAPQFDDITLMVLTREA
jgi:serine phosphatase RsbU (regulator of sigma subunit)